MFFYDCSYVYRNIQMVAYLHDLCSMLLFVIDSTLILIHFPFFLTYLLFYKTGYTTQTQTQTHPSAQPPDL